jgi:hypothetical protein
MLQQHTCLVNLSTDLKRLQDTLLASNRQKLNRNYYTIIAGYGKCTVCSCPGFSGPTYTCNMGGCSHNYQQHLNTY